MSDRNSIHVAFGFHVNCYHSYRGDTNDNLGFGSDIRIIRKTLDVLDGLNARGVPVKGTWDCENFFSLEKILPEYAPDIIERMKKRVAENGDEQIIMGYSNGALAPMNEEEFTASIELAVTNPAGSGSRLCRLSDGRHLQKRRGNGGQGMKFLITTLLAAISFIWLSVSS